MIDYEITYLTNPLFVFHDSRGIEAGAKSDNESELRTVLYQVTVHLSKKFSCNFFLTLSVQMNDSN